MSLKYSPFENITQQCGVFSLLNAAVNSKTRKVCALFFKLNNIAKNRSI